MDGSRPPELETTLDADAPAILTRVRVVAAHDVEARSETAACFEQDRDLTPAGPTVVRVGVTGESVTVRDPSRRGLFSCDNSLGAREEDRDWCGGAFGQLYAGHLRDPRLDLGPCRAADGGLIGFAWVQPAPGTEFVVVGQPGYSEVYEAAAGLPVRVTTRDVDAERSRASFAVSEHARNGALIRRYRLEASVAG